MTFDQLDLRSLISKRCDEERSRAEAGRGASNACEERERASPRSGAQRWPRSIDGPRAIIPGDIEPAGFDLSRKRRSSTRYANNGHAIMITSSARSRPEGGGSGGPEILRALSLSLLHSDGFREMDSRKDRYSNSQRNGRDWKGRFLLKARRGERSNRLETRSGSSNGNFPNNFLTLTK